MSGPRQILLILFWLLLISGVIAWPFWVGSSTLADDLTRRTVRVSLAFYAAAAAWMLAGRHDSLTRLLWTLGWASYLIHLFMAFHFYHHGSHAEAVAHTAEVSGFGPGIYVSHLFTILWTADVIYWWLRPERYVVRPPWIGRCLHAFMAFIIFNATVVYETGFIRWAGVAMFAMFGFVYVSRYRAKRKQEITSP